MLELRVSVTAEVTVAKIIGENDDDVRRTEFRSERDSADERKQKIEAERAHDGRREVRLLGSCRFRGPDAHFIEEGVLAADGEVKVALGRMRDAGRFQIADRFVIEA